MVKNIKYFILNWSIKATKLLEFEIKHVKQHKDNWEENVNQEELIKYMWWDVAAQIKCWWKKLKEKIIASSLCHAYQKQQQKTEIEETQHMQQLAVQVKS